MWKRLEPNAALFKAARHGNPRSARKALVAGASANTQDAYSQSPLHIAALANDLALAKLLIEFGADVNAQDALGNTPLRVCFASTEYGTEVAELLIANGANVHARTHAGTTLWDLATRHRPELLVLLEKAAKSGAASHAERESRRRSDLDGNSLERS